MKVNIIKVLVKAKFNYERTLYRIVDNFQNECSLLMALLAKNDVLFL